jgi:predicted double-glycine peptidase
MNTIALFRAAALSVAAASALPAAAGDTAVLTGAAPYTIRMTSLKQIRFARTVRQQYDFSCGSAALATLLSHHYGYAAGEAQIFEQMFRNGDQQKIRQQGFSLLDMQRYLAAHGFRADGFELPLSKLQEAKLPAIVLLSERGYNHFVVIKGLDADRVLLGDPSSGTRSMPLSRFNEVWRNKLLFVVHGFPGSVSFNGSSDWMAAPAAPLGSGISRETLASVTMAVHGPGDF